MKTFLKINTLILLAVLSISNAQAQFGTLDSSFATNGTFQTTGSVATNYSRAMVELTSGEILMAKHYSPNSSSEYFSEVSKITSSGAYDNSFGGFGIFVIPNGVVFNIRITAMKVQTDGKIVVAGTCTSTASTSSTRTFFVARILADGSGLDNLFNGGQGYHSAPLLSTANPSYVYDVLVTTGGKIVVVGNTLNSTTGSQSITLARLNSDGTSDNSFGFLGSYSFVKENNYNQATSAVQLANGDILVGGFLINGAVTNGLMVKVLADGSGEDNTWSANGYSTPVAGVINAIALLPSNEVICAGTFDNKMHVGKLNTFGSLVSSFGTSGIFSLSGGISTSYDVAIQADDKIVIGGGIENTSGKSNLCLLRLNTNGVLDNTFGQTGKVEVPISSTGNDFVRDIAINSSGSIYAFGSTNGEQFVSKFSVFWPTAVTDIYKDVQLTVYPNPSKSNINISLSDTKIKEASVNVYSMLGNVLFTQKINAFQETKIDVSSLSAGQYIIEVQDNKQRTVVTKKFSMQ